MSSLLNCFEVGSNVASVATAVVAVWFFASERIERSSKIHRLREYLKAEKLKGADKGQRTLLQIVRSVGLTESEAVDASFRCPHIARRVKVDEAGLAKELFLEYSDTGD